MSGCKHRLEKRWCSAGNNMFFYRCKKCKEEVGIPMTSSDKREYKKYIDNVNKEARAVHTVWHKFVKKFKDKNEKYKYSGYALMVRIARWAKHYQNSVFISPIDDTFFASSDLVIITHETKTAYMGATAIVVTQCDDFAPKEFFLYPCDVDALLDILKILKKKARDKKE